MPDDGLTPDWDALTEEATELLSAYIRVDTVNPPGNETRACEFFGAILDREGIPYRLYEPADAPGRGTLVATLPGDGTGGKQLILLNHTDVVPFERQHWSVDPLGGEVSDGYIWGRGSLDLVFGDQGRDEAGCPGFLDEAPQEGRAGAIGLRRADGLLHRREAAIEDARAGKLLRELDEAGPKSGQHVQLLGDELAQGVATALRADQGGVLDVAIQPQAVGAPPGSGDAHAPTIDLLDRRDRRAGGNQVRRLDLRVRLRELDLLRALGFRADQADVPDVGADGVGELTGGVERDELQRHAEALGKGPGQVGRDAVGVAVRAAARDEERVRHVDPRAQHAAGREFGSGLIGHCEGRPFGDAVRRGQAATRTPYFSPSASSLDQVESSISTPSRKRSTRRRCSTSPG